MPVSPEYTPLSYRLKKQASVSIILKKIIKKIIVLLNLYSAQMFTSSSHFPDIHYYNVLFSILI